MVGVRNPESYTDPITGPYRGVTIKKGTPLCIYSGELIEAAEGDRRAPYVLVSVQTLPPWLIGRCAQFL